MKENMYNYIIDNFCYEGFYFENLRIEKPNGFSKTIKRDYDLIVFNPKKIILFARMDNEIDPSEIVFTMRAALNCIVEKLSLSLNDFIICGSNDNNLYFLNKYNDRLFVFKNDLTDEFVECINNELSYGAVVFDYDKMRLLSDSLSLSSSTKVLSKTTEKVRTAADGTVFVNKHGEWKEASELNTETLYALSVFGGMFGLHLFYQKKNLKGILYLLTLGLFGIGWFFDCLEILIGVYRDPNGRYLIPLNNKLSGFVMMLLGVVFYVAVYFVIMFVCKFAFNIFSNTLTSN